MSRKSSIEQRVIELNFSLYAAILVAVVALVAIGVCLGQNLSGFNRSRTRSRVNSSSSTLSSNSTPKKKKSKSKNGGGNASLSSLSVTASHEKLNSNLENDSDAEEFETTPIIPPVVQNSSPVIISSVSSPLSPSKVSPVESGSNEGFAEMGNKKKKSSNSIAKERVEVMMQPDPPTLKTKPVLVHDTEIQHADLSVEKAAIRYSSSSDGANSVQVSLSSPSLDEFLKTDADVSEMMDRPRLDSGRWETVDKNKGKSKKNSIEQINQTAVHSSSADVEKRKEGKKKENPPPIEVKGSSSAASTIAATAAYTNKIEMSKDLSLTAISEKEIKPEEPQLVTQIYTVDAKKLGYLIGPRGETRQSLQDKTGTKITMPKTERDTVGTVDITVCGVSEGVALALKALGELQLKGYSCLLGGDDFAEGSVSVHPMFLSEIIGPKGSCIKAIQDHTGARVTIPPNTDRKDSQPIRIGLAGPRPKIEEAKKIIKEITKYRHHVVTHPGYVHAELEMPTSLHSSIIGPKGAEIKQIQSTYKVVIHIPSVAALASGEAVNKNVVVVGDSAAVAAAECFLKTKIVEHNAKLAAAVEKEAKAKEAAEKKVAESAAAAAVLVSESTDDEIPSDADPSHSFEKVDKSDSDGIESEKPASGSGTWAAVVR